MLVLAGQLLGLEETLVRQLQTGARLGLLGAREATLKRAIGTASAARLVVQREIGSLLRETSEAEPDPGGQVAEGEHAPAGRQLKAELGLSSQRASEFRKLADVDAEAFASYTAEVAEGERAPKSPAAVVNAIERGPWGSDECYTPKVWVDAARSALGGVIDCDPCSCLAAQAGLVRASWWYSLDTSTPVPGSREDALAEPLGYSTADVLEAVRKWRGYDGLRDDASWGGAWWLNPPYSADAVKRSHDRIRQEIGRSKGVVLVNADGSKAAQQELLRACVSAQPAGRIAFWSPRGVQLRGNDRAQVLFGVGIDALDWSRALGELAACLQPIARVEPC